ncbi:hypothetical protein [Pseudomonas yamanorum]|uniref:hypothetical protein n=1 Tax=Pseudomonas yamanorum TaxID=515393 RepID=UPI0012FD2EBB|nr:hypothetical protein [Pseudomonas yamanorum]
MEPEGKRKEKYYGYNRVIAASVRRIKQTSRLSHKVGDADFKMLVADLHSALGDAKLESGELKMKLAVAQEQIVLLQEQIKQKTIGQPTYTSEGVYSFNGVTGRFCTSCWDVDERRVRLANVPSDFYFAGKWMCPKCNAHYAAEE